MNFCSCSVCAKYWDYYLLSWKWIGLAFCADVCQGKTR